MIISLIWEVVKGKKSHVTSCIPRWNSSAAGKGLGWLHNEVSAHVCGAVMVENRGYEVWRKWPPKLFYISVEGICLSHSLRSRWLSCQVVAAFLRFYLPSLSPTRDMFFEREKKQTFSFKNTFLKIEQYCLSVLNPKNYDTMILWELKSHLYEN